MQATRRIVLRQCKKEPQVYSVVIEILVFLKNRESIYASATREELIGEFCSGGGSFGAAAIHSWSPVHQVTIFVAIKMWGVHYRCIEPILLT
jgi:hypothetical protein